MRWYDEDEALRACLDGLKRLDPRTRVLAVRAAVDSMNEVEPGFIDAHVEAFPLHFAGRRWYDDDGPETWLLFHGLEQASEEMRRAVTCALFAEFVVAA